MQAGARFRRPRLRPLRDLPREALVSVLPLDVPVPVTVTPPTDVPARVPIVTTVPASRADEPGAVGSSSETLEYDGSTPERGTR